MWKNTNLAVGGRVAWVPGAGCASTLRPSAGGQSDLTRAPAEPCEIVTYHTALTPLGPRPSAPFWLIPISWSVLWVVVGPGSTTQPCAQRRSLASVAAASCAQLCEQKCTRSLAKLPGPEGTSYYSRSALCHTIVWVFEHLWPRPLPVDRSWEPH